MAIDSDMRSSSGGAVGPLGQPSPAELSSGAALAPEAIASIAEDLGVKKARLDGATLFGLAVLGGAFVALGALFSTVVMAGAEDHIPYGVTRLLSGLTFSLGLVLVVVAGAQLFTSDCLMVMAWASGRLRFHEMIRVWSIVWSGNFVGALGTAVLVFLSGQYGFGHGSVGDTALYIASTKSALPMSQAFFLAILCNVLVCLAVWLSFGAKSVGDKILAVVFPVTAFVAAGFEHCVADMYFMPLGLLIERGAPESFWIDAARFGHVLRPISVPGFLMNLAAVTLGNWIGGTVLVGTVYWFLYRRRAGLSPKEPT
jgi:formate transporter